MFPDLSYLIHYFFGLAPDNVFSVVKTFGLFLGFSFIASGLMLFSELKRKENLGQIKGRIENVVIYKPIDWKEIGIQAFINFIIGFKLFYIYFHFSDFKTDPASIIFSKAGHLFGGLLFGILTIMYWSYKMSLQLDKNERKADVMIYPHQRVYEITGLAAISGLVGSKLFSILENFGDFIKDPIGNFFSGSGLTIYGGLILAYIVVYRYLKVKEISPIHMIDAIAPTLMLGYAVGRMGCHLSGDGDWGIINELAKPSWFFLSENWWAYSYPHNVLNEGVSIPDCTWAYCSQLSPKVFPTPLYESCLAFLITGFLWSIRKKIKPAGVLFFIYCTLNGFERIFIEAIRVNPRYDILGFHPSMAQGIAFILILIGIIGIVYYKKKNILV